MSAIETVLARLEGVRKAGHSQWMAKCPAHQDKSASLSIGETGDGKVLMHCFAACSTSDVLDSMGLELIDLFPERLSDSPGARRNQAAKVPSAAILQALAHEITTAAIITAQLVDSKQISEADWKRLATCANRIGAAANGY